MENETPGLLGILEVVRENFDHGDNLDGPVNNVVPEDTNFPKGKLQLGQDFYSLTFISYMNEI